MKRALLGIALAGAAAAIAAYAADGDGSDAAEGRRLFTKGAVPPCSLCHTLKDAGAQAEIGPSLDELKPDLERIVKVIRAGSGVMPPYTTLSDQDVQVLARYVAKYSGAR
jgi:mono/diheme cytochrome c family protein